MSRGERLLVAVRQALSSGEDIVNRTVTGVVGHVVQRRRPRSSIGNIAVPRTPAQPKTVALMSKSVETQIRQSSKSTIETAPKYGRDILALVSFRVRSVTSYVAANSRASTEVTTNHDGRVLHSIPHFLRNASEDNTAKHTIS